MIVIFYGDKSGLICFSTQMLVIVMQLQLEIKHITFYRLESIVLIHAPWVYRTFRNNFTAHGVPFHF